MMTARCKLFQKCCSIYKNIYRLHTHKITVNAIIRFKNISVYIQGAVEISPGFAAAAAPVLVVRGGSDSCP
jgi:hypothetical protein